jgi:IMP dehydrogenase
MKEALTYDDVLLVPQYSDIKSRKEVDISSDLDEDLTFDLPIISSPMDTVTESEMAYAISKMGGLGIIHRYNSIEEQAGMVAEVVGAGVEVVGAAIGVSDDYFERAQTLVENGAKVICVDVAHGHHILMKNALGTLRQAFDDNVHIMAGNVATLKGINALADWGAQSIRCNIGGGSICSTRIQTGHGLPGLQTIFDCARTGHDVAIIADGGIRTSGDIVKALAAGADFVMLGSLLAGTLQSPGDIVTTPEGLKKRYRGMASKDAQMDWRGRYSSNEGVSTFIKYKGEVKDVLQDLRGGIVSGFSYSGARNLTSLQNEAVWVKQTGAGLSESKTHINK